MSNPYNRDEFKALSAAEKRVAIAQDVLLQVSIDRLVPAFQTYGDYGPYEGKEDISALTKEQLCSVVNKFSSCDACAIGSVFLSALKFANDLTVGEAYPYPGEPLTDNVGFFREIGGAPSLSVLMKYLERFFAAEQLYLMENAFEAYDRTFSSIPEEVTQAAYRFCLDCESPNERLDRIMKNIIDNKGEFRP